MVRTYDIGREAREDSAETIMQPDESIQRSSTDADHRLPQQRARMIGRVLVAGEAVASAVQAALESGARGYVFRRSSSGFVLLSHTGEAVRLEVADVVILALLAEGLSSAEIAETATTDEADVAAAIARIEKAAGTRNRAHLVLLALRAGVIE